MKILYDISVLGVAQRFPAARAGVARVVERVAFGLSNAPECKVTFYAGDTVDDLTDSLESIRSKKHFQSANVLHSNFLGVRSRLRQVRYDPEIVAAPQFKSIVCGIESENASKLKILKRAKRRLATGGERILEKYLQFEDWLQLANADILHSPFHGIPLTLRKGTRAKIFLTIYDLIPVLHPDLFPDHILDMFRQVLTSLSPDDWVLCISKSTRDDLCNYLKIDASRTFVTYLAATPELFYTCADQERLAFARRKYNIPDGPYLLTLNTLEPRKNIDQVIRCFTQLLQEQSVPDLNLVLAGSRGWLDSNIFDSLPTEESMRNRIIFTGRIDDNDLAPLYSGALAFVYPSLYEGFGLPPLEAMQCGVPVITSNTSSLPEVVGDAGILLDPMDSEALCQSLYKVYSDASMRTDMAFKSLRQAKRFSWEKCIEQTIAAYRVALAS